MLRKIFLSILVAVAAVFALAFAGCNFGGGDEPQPDNKVYIIQYFDGTSTRTIQVQNGDLYNLTQLPQKEGCDFLGLFNAEEGGVKYIDANGMCTMPFSGTSNLVLYPQFEAKTFTFEFDYGESGDTSYSVDVSYGEKMPAVPAPSNVYGKEFVGWFTEKDGKGTEIIAETVVNNANFNLNSDSKKITFYAQYSDIYYSVKLYVGEKLISEQSVKCGSPIADLLVKELPDGRTVADWSRYENGSPIWETTVEEDLVLYAVKIGCNITFDTKGGSAVPVMIGYGGQRTQLPSPVKDNYDFMGWVYNGENIGTYFTMPNEHITLTAEWKQSSYIVTYDVVGGEAIDSKYVRVGTSVPLPEASKQYNKFVCWKYNGAEVPETLKMPEKNITLTAVWERTHYCVTIVSSLDGSKIKETYVLLETPYTFEQPVKVGYDCLGIFDSADKEYTGAQTFNADKTFTAKYSAKTFEVAYSLQGGVISGGASGKAVTFNSSYSFPVPTRSGYVFTGWVTSGGSKLTDHKGVGSSKWNIASNTTAYANWISGTAKFAEYTEKKITDSGVEKQYYDTVNLKNLFGRSLAEYRALGCTKITIKIALDIREIDDGYQAMGISNTHGTWTGNLWENYNIEHGSGKTDKNRWTHNFTCTLNLNNVNDIIYLIYSAHGSLDDDWYRCSVVLDMTIS